MATTGIWKIEKRLDHVIKYTTDENKTINEEFGNQNYNDLHNAIEYIETDYKTEKQLYVSGINCMVESAFDEMLITKRQYNKTGGILGYHAFQSFAENEVTASQAHEIGIKLAEEMWGDRFEVIVSTHLNTNHIHNHFVINSVSFKDGKKYYDKRETYAELRHLSDSLCHEYGLSVLEEKPCRHSKINYANYQHCCIHKSPYYSMAKEDIDFAIGQAYSLTDFENTLKSMKYEVKYRYGKLTIRGYSYKKNIRVERIFGEEYSIEKIKEKIATISSIRIPFPEEKKKSNFRNNSFNNQKQTGLKGLYLHYCYLLKVFPQEYPNKQLPASIRVDSRKLDEISAETKLLVSKNLDTYEQFFLYKKDVYERLNILLEDRSKLWYKYRKSKSNDDKKEIRILIEELSDNINPLQKEVMLLKNIEKRSGIMEKNIKEIEVIEQERKESDRNEFR